MTLEYFYKTGEMRHTVDYGCGPEQEWDGDDGYYFEFEIDSEQIKTVFIWMIKNKIKPENKFVSELIYKMLETVEELDQLEELAEYYREEIAEYYEDEAMQTQED